MADMTIMKKSI